MSTMQTAMKMALIRTMPLCLPPDGAAPGRTRRPRPDDSHSGSSSVHKRRGAASPPAAPPPWLSFCRAFITAGKAADAAFGTGAKLMSAMPQLPEMTPARRPAFAAGFFGWIEEAPRAAFAAFLALHFVVWTALPTLLYANLPLDLIEALTYGREWQLGSDKLPPLPWWLVEIVYRTFGVDAAYYATAQIAVIVTFAIIFFTARPLVGAAGALLAVLIIDGMHYFQYTAVKFNHDVVQLPFWALAGYSFHAALKRGRLVHWLLLGIAIGGALWAKYFVVLLVIPYALFLVFDRDGRRALTGPGPYLALVVAICIIAPNIWWLAHNDFSTFPYGEARASPARGWFDHFLHPAMFIVGQTFFALPSLFIAAALLWPRLKALPPLPSTQPNARWGGAADAFDRRIVTLIAFGPGLTAIAITALSG